ncbi:double-strand break repair helicase AddA [Novosphingobium sp.]|uniref:double-strand break repair helicase AddA n=1 Tax=Novosphingobium sp. TaxID=1874826 RepID=UPI0038B78902
MSVKVYPLKDNQLQAVAPERTVWLSASAGTGKTQVLSARVLRLLLQPGVEPDQLLCLTFTKAGAAEMATRVNEVLARWVRLDDTQLAIDLKAIGAPFDPATVQRARSRFAAVLDCPGGGLRIGTIHAFSQWLLSAFPVEAGLLPGTRAMEDRDRDLLFHRVLADLLVSAQDRGDDTLLDALALLSLRYTEVQVRDYLLRCAAARDLWHGPGAWQSPLRPRINRVLGLAANADADGLAAIFADDAFDVRSLRRCHTAQLAWNTANGAKMAAPIGAWLAAPAAERAQTFDAMAKALLNDKGEPKWLSNLLKVDGDYAEYAGRVIACIEEAREWLARHRLADLLEPALTLGQRFALAWDEAKQREGFIDFDDQIRAAAALLTRQDSAEWIRFKLDRRFDHVLVDEAQDTNKAQWRIVLDGLVDDFFSGQGQHDDGPDGEVHRTLFVVGDYKQAIFRFQGTSPENFRDARERVAKQLGELAQVLDDPARDLLDLGLGRSYRTARPILDFVDRAIDAIGPEAIGLSGPREAHVGEERAGKVVLWRAVGHDDGEDAANLGDEVDDSDGDDGWLSRPDRALADTLARQVRGWLERGFPLGKGEPRLAGPGDVMILVRKRKELAGLIVARLHAQGVPVAGVDRLRLGAPLAVKDLLAALRFAAQPLDDLNLANLLVSPLIGWTQEELLAHGWRPRKAALWEHLRQLDAPLVGETRERLGALLARADYVSPDALLHWLLVGPWDGRRRLVARLGEEAADPIAELLNAAMAYGAAHPHSLAGFLNWFDAGDGDIKREAGGSNGLVRVMTVHGSKGLQAPIVILADAADDPDKAMVRGLELDEVVLDARRPVPLPPLRKEEKIAAVRAAEDLARAEERQEHWRLLYVAMTRAEEALFITGALPARVDEPPKDSWYARLAPLFATDHWIDDPLWGGRRELGSLAEWPKGVPQIGLKPAIKPAPEPLPDVLTVPVGPEPRPPRPLAPSSLGDETAPDPPVKPGPHAIQAAQRGTLIHRLIERLPDLGPERREVAALEWLKRNAAQFAEGERQDMARAALQVVTHPDWQDAFGPGSLAEVPLAALVEDRVVTGTIDRLLITPTHVRIIDFKTGRRPPVRLEDIPAAYLRQMAAYRAALRVIHPGRIVEAALLYTHAPVLFTLPDALLDAQKLGLSGPEETFSA